MGRAAQDTAPHGKDRGTQHDAAGQNGVARRLRPAAHHSHSLQGSPRPQQADWRKAVQGAAPAASVECCGLGKKPPYAFPTLLASICPAASVQTQPLKRLLGCRARTGHKTRQIPTSLTCFRFGMTGSRCGSLLDAGGDESTLQPSHDENCQHQSQPRQQTVLQRLAEEIYLPPLLSRRCLLLLVPQAPVRSGRLTVPDFVGLGVQPANHCLEWGHACITAEKRGSG